MKCDGGESGAESRSRSQHPATMVRVLYSATLSMGLLHNVYHLRDLHDCPECCILRPGLVAHDRLRTTGDRLGRNPPVLISHPYVRVSLDLPAPRASLKCPSVRKSMSSISSRIALCAQHSSTHSQSQHGGLTTTYMNHLLEVGASHAYSAENRRNRPIRHCHQWREGTAGQRFSRCDVVWLQDTQS